MNTRHYLRLGWFLLVLLTACKPDPEVVSPDKPVEPVPQEFIRPKGKPTGQLIQKTIGPEGGTLTSADNRLRMTVPAGAVNQTTQFFIQPITNTLTDSAGLAYRLLPEGTTFAKPVTLQMHYDQADLLNTAAQALFLAYQGSDGVWKYLPATDLDEVTKTLTVQTHHFSDWGVFAEFYLIQNKSHLKPGETANLFLMAFDFTNPFDVGSPEVQIGKTKVLNNPENIQNWKASAGQLAVHSSKTGATYTAPATVPADGLSVQITVDVVNFIPQSRVKRKGATGHAVLFATLIVEGEAYFHLSHSIGGDNSELDVIYGAFVPTDDGGVITATLPNNQGLAILIHADPNDYVRTYPYYFSERDPSYWHKAEISLVNMPDHWMSRYDGCTANGQFDAHVSPGTVAITGQVKIDGRNYLTGRFTATLYVEKGVCGLNYSREQQTIEGDFRVPFLQ